MLLIAHLDVVEAKREDWTSDPFQLVEKDGLLLRPAARRISRRPTPPGFFSFLKLKREGFVPDRDLIMALTADEEGGTMNGVDWLLRITASGSTPTSPSTRTPAV